MLVESTYATLWRCTGMQSCCSCDKASALHTLDSRIHFMYVRTCISASSKGSRRGQHGQCNAHVYIVVVKCSLWLLLLHILAGLWTPTSAAKVVRATRANDASALGLRFHCAPSNVASPLRTRQTADLGEASRRTLGTGMLLSMFTVHFAAPPTPVRTVPLFLQL